MRWRRRPTPVEPVPVDRRVIAGTVRLAEMLPEGVVDRSPRYDIGIVLTGHTTGDGPAVDVGIDADVILTAHFDMTRDHEHCELVVAYADATGDDLFYFPAAPVSAGDTLTLRSSL